MSNVSRRIEATWITLKGMGLGVMLPVAVVALTFSLYVVLLRTGVAEDGAKSVFWQLGLFPISFLGMWWALLFARAQLDEGGELVFVFEKHPLVTFGFLYSLLYAVTIFIAAALSSLAVPDKMTFLLLHALSFAVRGFFFASLFLVLLSLTKSSAAGLLVAFSFAALNYFVLLGVVPAGASLLPAQIPSTFADAIALYAPVVGYSLVGLAMTYRAERGYFG